VTETIFSWPGIGRLTVSAISNRDYALVQGCILAVGLTYVLVNLLTDLAYTVANPRIRAYTTASNDRDAIYVSIQQQRAPSCARVGDAGVFPVGKGQDLS